MTLHPFRQILAFVVFACLSLPGRGEAQLQLSRLDGVVLDASGRPSGGVTVTLSDPLGTPLREAVTDVNGRFTLEDVATGRYALRTQTGNAAPAEVPVSVEGAWPVTVTLRLRPTFRDALTVQASLPVEAVATRASIGRESIASVPIRARGRGLQDVVATLPGWSTEDNGLLHSRGVDDGFLYVIDGVPVYERLDQTFGVAPDAATIDSMNVVTGYIPPEFGYKAGGVIELRSRDAGSSWRGNYDVGLASDDARDAGVNIGGRVAGSPTLWLSASGQRSDRFLDPVHPDNLHNTGGVASTAGQIDMRRGDADRFTAGWGFGRSSFDVPNTDEQEEAGQDQRQRVGQGNASFSWQRTWSPGTVSHAAAYRRESSSRLGGSAFDTPLTSEADRSLSRTGLIAGLAQQRGAHLLKAGFEVQRLAMHERFQFAVTDEEEAEEAGLSEEAIEHDLDDPFLFTGRAHPILFSAYLQDSWQAAPALTIAAGLRFDRSELLLTRTQWSPRVGIAYRAAEHTTLRGSVSRFFQPPQPEYLLLSSSPEARRLSPFAEDLGEGGADVEPERQWAFEAGVEQRLPAGLRLDAAYWRRHIREAADPNVFFGTTIIFPNAVAKGRAQGFDLRLEAPRRGPWSAYANLSVAKVIQTGPITGGLFLEDEVIEIGPGTEFTPDHDQRLAASGGVTWAGKRGLTLSLVGRYESGAPLEVEEDELDELRERPGADRVNFGKGRVEPRTILSAVASVPVWRSNRYTASLRGALFNLLGDDYAYNFGNPFSGTHFGAPRTFSIALRLDAR